MAEVIKEQPEIFRTDPRNPYIAFSLSLLLPGLGQVYNGQLKKAALFFSLELLIPFLFGITRGATSFYGLFLLLFITIAFRIFVAVDGAWSAKRQDEYVLKPYNTWYYHLLIAIGIIVIFSICNTSALLGIKTFKISSGTNDPTVHYGDCVVVDTRIYKNKEPEYGDIVTYQKPLGEIYTFRVVGKPNDRLEIVDNIVSINGKASKVTFIKDTSYETPVAEFKVAINSKLVYRKNRFFCSGNERTNLKIKFLYMDIATLEEQIETGDLEAVRQTLSQQPALAYSQTSHQTSPLMLACYYNRQDIASLISERMKELTIFEACAIGKFDEVTFFVVKDPTVVNKFSSDGFTPLGLACLFNREELARFLILKGADVNLPSKNGFNVFPIHSAVAANNYNTTKVLLDAGAYPNVCQKAGIAPLHTAAQLGNIELIILLLEHGAEVNLRMEGGKLPADLAQEKGFEEIAIILRED